jgi:oligopeptide/dipeptide ABC transporter ATP-binding protein
MTEPLLRVADLRIAFRRGGGHPLVVVDAANLALDANQAVGIVGESGSGKTMLCRSLIGTLGRRGAEVVGGSIAFNSLDLAGAPERVWRQVRGRQIGYVPQSALAGLNPVLPVRTQLVEAVEAVRSLPRSEAEREAIRLLDMVRIARPQQVLDLRPSQLSGGMRQRVMIATALAQHPRLLIADEPTTALDVTVQHDILTLIADLRRELGMALILVSHDLAVIEEVCDSLVVMYAGATVESGPIAAVTRQARHPYTHALRISRVDLATPGEDIAAIGGSPPAVGAWPPGCRFWPRCPLADEACKVGVQPPLRPFVDQQTACIRAEQLTPTVGALS